MRGIKGREREVGGEDIIRREGVRERMISEREGERERGRERAAGGIHF